MRLLLPLCFALVLTACPAERAEVCHYGGQPYGIGEVFPADDGCNECVCAEGPAISCSARTCGGEDGGADDSGLDGGVAADGPGVDTARADATGDAAIAPDVIAVDVPPRPNDVVAYPQAACDVVSVNGAAPSGPPAPGDAVVVSADALPPPTSGAAVTQVLWSLVRSPPGSRTGLRAASGFTTSLGRKSLASAQLDRSRGPDLAGTYVLRAWLQDDQGGTATHHCHLDVRPREALYVELSWDRADVNLDLRLARRTAAGGYCAVGVLPQVLIGLAQPCGDAADVCYFGNCLALSGERPDWDGDQDVGGPGDPELEYDNWSGLGPEVITIDEPIAGSFLVSAHFWNGARPQTTARVAVWIRGELWGFAEQTLSEQQWWEPLQVHWESGAQPGVCVEGDVPGDQLCGLAPRCTPLGECVTCSDDEECGPGASCAAALHDCAPQAAWCLDDTECASGQLCVWSTDVCVDPACVAAASCADEEDVCDEHTSLCTPAPVTCDETDEPNNSIATATPFTPGMSALLCRGDLDYISVAGHADAPLHVYISLQTDGSESSQVRAALLDAAGEVVDEDEAASASGRAELAVVPSADADYYVRIDGSAARARQYSYGVDVVECLPEPGEPNDSLDQAGNAPLAPGSHERTLCGEGDDDFYLITAPTGLRTRIVVRYDAALFDVGLELLTEAGVRLGGSSRGQGAETVRYDNEDAPFPLVARVSPGWSSGAEVQRYTIEVISEPIPDCNDGFEPNDDTSRAAPIGLGTTSANLCDLGDEDFFAIELAAGGSLQATIDFLHSEGDIDVRLLDSNGKSLDTSASTRDQEYLELTGAGAAGRYYIQIYPYQSGTPPDRQDYDLTVTGSGLADAGAPDVSGAPDAASAPDTAPEDAGAGED